MRVHIVKPYDSMAMTRLTDPLSELARLYEVTQSADVDPAADVNIHAPYHTLIGDKDYGSGKHISMYTHYNPGTESALAEMYNRADIITAMSFTGRDELLTMGADPAKVWVTPSAADPFHYGQRTIMINGYPQPNARKRESILFDLAWKYDLTAFEFLFTGNGWEEIAAKLTTLGLSCKLVATLSDERLAELYRLVDLLLVTGYAEGGSLPILEAMASGTPVLSPRFGYAADYLDEADLYDGPDELMEKIHALTEKSVRYHQIVKAWSWKDYAAEYARLVGRLTDNSVDLYPERGASRYEQVLSVIDEIKPRRICEIGTWNGNRALQMLQTAAKYYPMKRIEYQGFDLFDEQTGEQVRRELSKYAIPLEVARRRIEATGANVELVPGDTIDTIQQLRPADLYFIDGGHSEYTIENDGLAVLFKMDELGGVAVFDDYYHAGKPEGVGCNQLIDNLPPHWSVTHLPARTQADDGREIGMVKVCHNISTVI